MKLQSLGIFRYELPFTESLKMMGAELSTRTGLIIRVTDEEGNWGFGEIAPFPGLNKENPQQALQQLRRHKTALLEIAFGEDVLLLSGEFERLLGGFSFYPSVRCGIEMAVLNCFADQRKLPLHRLISSNQTNDFLHLNGLLTGTRHSIVAEARKLRDEGYRSLKIKTGREKPDLEIDLIREVRQAVGGDMELRLDANRAWNLEEAIYVGRHISQFGIEYIEEPLKNPEKLAEFYKSVNIPFALDESLSGLAPEDITLLPGLKALVLKPMSLGGFEITMAYCRQAAKTGIYPVISSVFESGIGLGALASFAAAAAPPKIAMGLDTHKWLRKDILAEPFPVRSGKIDMGKIDQNEWQVCTEDLMPA